MTLRQAVVFAILMENDDGILSKSPDYVKEKLRVCGAADNEYFLLQVLHASLRPKYHEYMKKWQGHLNKDENDGKTRV